MIICCFNEKNGREGTRKVLTIIETENININDFIYYFLVFFNISLAFLQTKNYYFLHFTCNFLQKINLNLEKLEVLENSKEDSQVIELCSKS